MSNKASSFNTTDLSDGFREVFSFGGHKLPPRGLECLEIYEEREFCTDVRDVYLSWDLLSAHVWVRDHHTSDGRATRILHTLKFPTGCKGFISSLVYIPKLKVYLGAALDMSFKIYDKTLTQIESIRHEERSLAHLCYHATANLLVGSSSTGVSLWRLFRNSAAAMAYTMERVFVFEEVREWMTKVEIDIPLGRIYAFAGQSVYVFDFPRRKLLHRLEKVHEMTVNVICWYGRSQFYLTGCGGGLIKCWTSLHSEDKLARQRAAGKPRQAGDDSPTFSLLHTFRLHTASVTGLVLHPTSGMAVSTSLDGVVRLLNLENFTEIYNINLDGVGVTTMRLLEYAPKGKKAIMFADVNMCIRVWRITTAVGFFGVMNSNVVSVAKFENMHEELITKFYDRSDPVCRLRRMTDVNGKVATEIVFADGSKFGRRDSDSESDEDEVGSAMRTSSLSMSRRSVASRASQGSRASSGAGEGGHAVASTVESALKAVQLQMNKATLKKIAEEENKRSRAFLSSSYVGSLSIGPQDLRIFSAQGATISVLEPEVLVDGIVCYTVSVYQHLLFCLFESGQLKTFCSRSVDAPLLLTVNTKAGSLHAEQGLCMSLIDELPDSAQRPGGKVNAEYLNDIRGNRIPWYITEIIAIGSKSGSLMFFDTLTNCECCYNLPTAQQVPIVDMHYRHRLKELFTLGRGGGKEGGSPRSCIRVFSVPSMECVLEVPDLQRVTVLAIAPSRPYFGVGCSDGDVRVFVMQSYGRKPAEPSSPSKAAGGGGSSSSSRKSSQMEVMREPGPGQDRAHKCSITGLAFSDDMKIYASCSSDQIVMMWTYSKQYIRSLSYNMPVVCLVFNGPPGDLVFSQNNYLLTITKGIWDAGGALLAMQDLHSRDPWTAGRLAAGGAADEGEDMDEYRGAGEEKALVPRDHGLGVYCAPKMPLPDGPDGPAEGDAAGAEEHSERRNTFIEGLRELRLREEEERLAHEKAGAQDRSDISRARKDTQRRDAELFSTNALLHNTQQRSGPVSAGSALRSHAPATSPIRPIPSAAQSHHGSDAADWGSLRAGTLGGLAGSGLGGLAGSGSARAGLMFAAASSAAQDGPSHGLGPSAGAGAALEYDTRHPRISVLPRKPAVMSLSIADRALSASKHVSLLNPHASMVLLATDKETKAEANLHRKAALAAKGPGSGDPAGNPLQGRAPAAAPNAAPGALAFSTSISLDYALRRKTFHAAIGGGPGVIPEEVQLDAAIDRDGDKKLSLKEMMAKRRDSRHSSFRRNSNAAPQVTSATHGVLGLGSSATHGVSFPDRTAAATATSTVAAAEDRCDSQDDFDNQADKGSAPNSRPLSPHPPDEIRPSTAIRTARFAE